MRYPAWKHCRILRLQLLEGFRRVAKYECTMKDLIRGSFVPDEIVQRMRQYNRRIFDLNKEKVYKLTKLDALLQRCNIRISNYVSSTDSKSYKDVVKLLSEGIVNAEKLTEAIHGRTVNRVGKEVITAALTGVVNEVDIDLIRQYREEILMDDKHLKECQEKLTEICRKEFPREFDNLQTIPGVKERSATSILSECYHDRQLRLVALVVLMIGVIERLVAAGAFAGHHVGIGTDVLSLCSRASSSPFRWTMS